MKNDEFIVGLHRYGNTLSGLAHAREIQSKLTDTVKVYAELDLKWFEQDGEYYFYCHHGVQLPNTTLNFIRTRKGLLKARRFQKLILLEEALERYNDLGLLVHVKNGIGDNKQAFKHLAKLYKSYKAQNVLMFSNALGMTEQIQAQFPEHKVGSVHQLFSRRHIIHSPDFNIMDNLSSYGLRLKQDDLPSDFCVLPPHNYRKFSITKPFIVQQITTAKRLMTALEHNVWGVSIHASARRMKDILQPLGL